MKYFIIILLFSNLSHSQTNSIEKELVRDFIENYTLENGELRIIANWPMKDSLIVKKHFDENISEFIKQKNDSLKITVEEKNLLSKLYIKSNITKWKDSDFDYKILDYNETMNYLKSNRDNKVLLISHPIFFRNNTIALVSYANLCCGNIFGSTGLGFLKKENGKWVKAKMINEGAY